jgi:hypothetical protein
MANLATLPNINACSSNALALNHDCLRTIDTTSASGRAETTAATSYHGIVVLQGFKGHIESDERMMPRAIECLLVVCYNKAAITYRG